MFFLHRSVSMHRSARAASRRPGIAVASLLLVVGSVTPALAQDSPASYTLEQAILVALGGNQDLERARLGLRSASQQVREAWGAVWPEVDAQVQYQRNLQVQEVFLPAIIFDPNAGPNDLVPVRFGADNNWSAQLQLSQTLFDRSVFIGVGAAGRYRNLQAEVVRGRAQEVASRVRRAYYTALLARERVRVTDESVTRLERTLEETRALEGAGLASSYDVLRLEVQLANLRPDLRRATNAVASAERDLTVELGRDGGERVSVSGRLHRVDLASFEANEGPNAELLRLVGYPDPLAASYEELRETAARMRSDLRQARLSVQLEGARASAERSAFFPKLSAFFNYGITAQEDGSLNPFGENSNQRITSSAVGLRLEVPIFSGFSRSARVQQRDLARRQAQVQLGRLEHEMDAGIRTALEALAEAKARADAALRAVEQARRGYEIVSAQYLAGTSSQLEVTDGEVALRESEFNYAEAVYDYLMAQADLDEALGVVPVVDTVLTPDGDLRLSRRHEVEVSERADDTDVTNGTEPR